MAIEWTHGRASISASVTCVTGRRSRTLVTAETQASRQASVSRTQHATVREVRREAREGAVHAEPYGQEPRRHAATAVHQIRQRAKRRDRKHLCKDPEPRAKQESCR